MSCDLNHSEDQRHIMAAATTLLSASYPVARRREDGPDDLAALAEFGLFALAWPEERGGSGFTVVEEALAHVLLGRHLVSSRALALPMAARLAAACGQDKIAQQAAAGGLGVCAAVRSGDSALLIDDAGAALAVVFGHRLLTLIAIEGLAKEDVAGLGHSIGVTRVRPGSSWIIGECTDRDLLDVADLLVSAQLLGVAEASRDLAVSYALVREQFGRPIGSFQAIKHHCANMAVAAEMLSAQLDMAAIAVRNRRDDARFQIAALRVLAPKTALANARACIQVHGGIGFSSEADAHHYLKQAHVLRHLLSEAAMLDLPAPLSPCTIPEERN